MTINALLKPYPCVCNFINMKGYVRNFASSITKIRRSSHHYFSFFIKRVHYGCGGRPPPHFHIDERKKKKNSTILLIHWATWPVIKITWPSHHFGYYYVEFHVLFAREFHVYEFDINAFVKYFLFLEIQSRLF